MIDVQHRAGPGYLCRCHDLCRCADLPAHRQCGGQTRTWAPSSKSVVVNAQTDPTEDSDHVAKILNFLNSSSVFSLPGFKSCWMICAMAFGAHSDGGGEEDTQWAPSVGAPTVPPVQKTAPSMYRPHSRSSHRPYRPLYLSRRSSRRRSLRRRKCRCCTC